MTTDYIDCFNKIDIFSIPCDIPEVLNNPFDTKIPPIAKYACEKLQQYLESKTEWHSELGYNNTEGLGKMFGVLIVKNQDKEIGYLAAFSGKLAESNHHRFFVPPLFDTLDPEGFYRKGEEEINKINREIEIMENNEFYLSLKEKLQRIINESALKIAALKTSHNSAKENRDIKRKELLKLQDDNYQQLLISLNNESARQHYELKDEKKKWKREIEHVKKEISYFEEKMIALKNLRKEKSAQLQQKLFNNYNFLNQEKESKNLLQIFKEQKIDLPPSGAGECTAPKLFQYAFIHNLSPISIAEFWWGKPPISEVRRHKEYYGACKSKCEPILLHMLSKTNVAAYKTIENKNSNKEVKFLYEDEDIAIIHKPHELLSVPGKKIKDSVYTRMREHYPNATGPIIVHRLDMSTSGLMVITKNLEAYQKIQSQFTKRKVKKKYLAVLDGSVDGDSGEINLPLRVDIDNRPHQLVCYQYGKPAKTIWQVIERKDNRTKIIFMPITGRTHQLRVHAAHQDGLNASILGDDIYGRQMNRLHLQAYYLEFLHPSTFEVMKFELEPEF